MRAGLVATRFELRGTPGRRSDWAREGGGRELTGRESNLSSLVFVGLRRSTGERHRDSL